MNKGLKLTLLNIFITTAIILTVSNDTVLADPCLIDTLAPTISITSPLKGSVITGTTSIAASVIDESGIAEVKFMVDGNYIGITDTEAPYEIGWGTLDAVNGSHMISVVARDASNNYSTSTLEILVNNPVSPPHPAQDIDRGLVFYQDMNDRFNDLSSNPKKVTWSKPAYTNGPRFAINPNDKAASTSQGYMLIEKHSDLVGMSNLTYSIWIKKNVATAYEWMLEIPQGYYLWLTNQGFVKAGVFNDSPYNSTSYFHDNIDYFQGNNTNWNHYAVTYDGNKYKLYINGIKVAEKSCTASTCLGNVRNQMIEAIVPGRRPNQYFNGQIDEVRIYNRTLSAEEVGTLYRK